MALVRLDKLRTRARSAADQVNSQFVSDSELNDFINASADELYDLLVLNFEDYFTTSASFPGPGTTVAGTETYAVPTDFYKLIGVDVQVDNVNWKALLPFNVRERNSFRNAPTVLLPSIFDTRYWLKAGVIHLLPVPISSVPAKFWYVPQRPQLTSDSSTFDGINGWEEYIVVDAAAKMLRKGEEDDGAMQRDKAALVERIRRASAKRDAGAVHTVSDVYLDEGGYL